MAPAQMVEAKDLPPEVGALSAAPERGTESPVVPARNGVAALEPSVAQQTVAAAAPLSVPNSVLAGWESDLESEAISLLSAGRTDVWDALTHRFESRLIVAALANTKGRRIEAAQKLGIGRNTITRKIQELGLE